MITIKEDLSVSVSGGRTSAYMAWLLLKDEHYQSKYNYHFVFANTGKEDERTLVFVDKLDKHFGLDLTWVEANVNPEHGSGTKHTIVSYETASRKGEPFEAVIKKYGIPNKAFPHCSRELKARPIHSFMKEKLNSKKYITAIGIRIDEVRRAKHTDKTLLYPLISKEHWITSHQVIDFWKKMPFDLEILPHQGNCDLCWKKSAKKKIKIIKESPEVAEWWATMEAKYSNGEYFFHRKNESTQGLIERSKTSKAELFDDEEMSCTCRDTLSEED